MTKALAQTYTVVNEYRARLSMALLAGCLLLAAAYAASVYSVVSRTVALQSLEKRTVALETSVESLDTQYLTLSSAVTPDSVRNHGMSLGTVSAYVGRTASLGSVAMTGHEL